MAIPFLRIGDYPALANTNATYSDGVEALYHAAYSHVLTKKKTDEPVVALGHLHAMDAELLDEDKTERMIMGGVEYVPVTAFNKDIAYTALGHIHKAQRIGGRENVRYSGSPLPMSFSELKYHHQVILFDVLGITATNIRSVSVPVTINLLRVPYKAKILSDVLKELELLLVATETLEKAPYLDVQVLLTGPEPTLKAKIEAAIKDKYVRLAKIEVKYPTQSENGENELATQSFTLKDLQPIEVFARAYKKEFHSPVPDSLLQLFNEVVQGLE